MERLPVVAHVLRKHPATEVAAADVWSRLVNRAAAAARLAMPAPLVCRLVQLDDVEQFATEAAFAALPVGARRRILDIHLNSGLAEDRYKRW